MSKSNSTSSQSLHQFIPALGLVWADHVTCRLLMSKTDLSTSLQSTHSSDTNSLYNFVDQREDSKTVSATNFSTEINSSSKNNAVRAVGQTVDFGLATRRKLEVVFAPHLPSLSIDLLIVRDGIFSEMDSIFLNR